jgi:hypothetical protein
LAQLEHIEAIEKRLWSAADSLRANSNYASNEYFLPVMGVVFLRHAYSRYLAVKARIGMSCAVSPRPDLARNWAGVDRGHRMVISSYRVSP